MSGGSVGDLSREEAKKGIKRRKISEAKVEPNSSWNHTSGETDKNEGCIVLRIVKRSPGRTERFDSAALGSLSVVKQVTLGNRRG